MTDASKNIGVKKLLVVDDDDQLRSAIRALLEGSGYVTTGSSNGAEALAYLQSNIPDLILCDVQMPTLDGFGLLEELRRSPRTSSIPFIFLTGQTDRADNRKGMMLGADDYVTKPFQPKELLQAIELRLQKRQAIEVKMEGRLDELRKSISLALPHEFRTPLTAILGFSEILGDSQALSQEEAAYIGSQIHASGKRLQHMLENMLLLADLELEATNSERTQLLRNSTCSLKNIIPRLVETLAAAAGRQGDIRVNISDARVKALDSHVAKAMEELVSNALKFSIKGTSIVVSDSIHEKNVSISIKDDGTGMVQEEIQRVGAYVQFDRNQNEQQGSGLGLAIVKKIAHLYNGTLSIESSHTQGTTATLILPLDE